MRFYIQYRFACESFAAFANVCVMSRHGLKAMLQSPFGHLPLWRVLGLLEVRLQLEGSWPFFFFRQDRGFDPSGSRQLPIKESDRDQCSVSLRQMACCSSFYNQMADRKFCILIVVLSFARSEHVAFDPIVHSLMLCFFLWLNCSLYSL